MSVDIKATLAGVLRTIGSVVPFAKAPADILAKVLDGSTALTPQEQAAVSAALAEHEKNMLTAFQTDADVAKVELASSDKYTSRARPTGLYVAYLVTLALVAATVLGKHFDTGAITELILPCWGYGGYYAYSRTQEKKAGVA